IAADTWEAAGGSGTIQYFPHGMSLVVSNTPRVQAQVQHLLETMRRVQDVQVVAEMRVLTLSADGFLKLRAILPSLKGEGPVVLRELEAFGLVRKAEEDTAAQVTAAPKITACPGQRVRLSVGAAKGRVGTAAVDLTFVAFVAADLQTVHLDVKAK